MIATALESPTRATLDDLVRVEGKAELISGRIVTFMSIGRVHARLTKRIVKRLDDHTPKLKGEAFGDSLVYTVPELRSGRESFSPDASFMAGPQVGRDEDFIDGPPTFAVEIRSKGDRGPAAEDQMERKREDYFEAGTPAVWDVDPSSKTVRLYSIDSPKSPIIFRSGDMAHAEPTLPGWSMPVDELFAGFSLE